MPLLIEHYGLIGGRKTAALVGSDGSIDWLCWPRFDSAACFAALLGAPQHGRWLIAPRNAAKSQQSYQHNTLILETTFANSEGEITVVDFMPEVERTAEAVHRTERSEANLIRIVRCTRGTMVVQVELIVRFEYGSVEPWIDPGEAVYHFSAGPDQITLRTDIKKALQVRKSDLVLHGEFQISEGEEHAFVLAHGSPQYGPKPTPVADPQQCLERTSEFWTGWAAAATVPAGKWSDAVVRSLITLKALTYEPTGGIVAAPTTSLPELIGGKRNWDYRYCWLRDATLTLNALMVSGYYEEATQWCRWLRNAVAGSPSQLQIMYGLAGERRLTEWEIKPEKLPGYIGSQPVRIGNGAYDQLQIDVFGEVMDAIHIARSNPHIKLDEDRELWPLQSELMKYLEREWRKPDEGIWEVRGGRRHFTHSKIMAWVAFDRAIKDAERYGFEDDDRIQRWRHFRDEIKKEVCNHGFNGALNSFVQSYGSVTLDASVLLIPIVGFLPPRDPRVIGTIKAIERDVADGGLMEDGFLLRYHTGDASNPDGLPPKEGVFLVCSFWLVEAYAMSGRVKKAKALFDRLLALRNGVGLLAEEYDTKSRRQVGNFPQAFSHIGLINAAHRLHKALARPV